MTGKPLVFKMAGHWLWQCDHGQGPMGDQFPAQAWRDPWAACLAAASKHAMLYHADDEVVEVIDL